jgi:hypothetical protein
MKNGQQGAFASMNEFERQEGLTKREYFAGLAMSSYLMTFYNEAKKSQEEVARRSVAMADILLKELDKKEEQ